jgi:hypothetical protein
MVLIALNRLTLKQTLPDPFGFILTKMNSTSENTPKSVVVSPASTRLLLAHHPTTVDILGEAVMMAYVHLHQSNAVVDLTPALLFPMPDARGAVSLGS